MITETEEPANSRYHRDNIHKLERGSIVDIVISCLRPKRNVSTALAQLAV